jgi:hypothetical protein
MRKINREMGVFLFGDMVGEVIVGILFISICVKTVLHVLKASVVNVNDIWGKGK